MKKEPKIKPWQGDNRRHKPDIWVDIVRALALSSWILFTFALVMSFYAAPEQEYGMLRYHGIAVRKFWETPLTGYLYLVLWFSAFMSYVSIIITHFRSRRKEDSKNFNLILLFLTCSAWVVYIILNVN